MSEQWTWRHENPDGTTMEDSSLPSSAFPTQADAEAYLGEGWMELSEAGVSHVSLLRDGEVVYRMSLAQS